jgi:hypothetical protein
MNVLKKTKQTIIIIVLWSAFTVLHLAFNPAKLEFWQSTAVYLSIGFIAIGGITLTWIKSCM